MLEILDPEHKTVLKNNSLYTALKGEEFVGDKPAEAHGAHSGIILAVEDHFGMRTGTQAPGRAMVIRLANFKKLLKDRSG